MHGLLDEEVAEILALFDEWGETDRSHRKLAHRARIWAGSGYLRRACGECCTSLTCTFAQGRGPAHRNPNRSRTGSTTSRTTSGSFDTTHFPAAGMAVLIIEDLVSRKWITEVVSTEETSTQVELGLTQALEAEGLADEVERRTDGLVDLDTDDEVRPILLAVSDNGAQMTSHSTRAFMALCAIVQHFCRPGTPTDQAWIESLNGHLKDRVPAPADDPGPGHPAR